MKGTIISGEEVLKILGEGDLKKLEHIYCIIDGGPLELIRCGYRETYRLIRDCQEDKVIFIKIKR